MCNFRLLNNEILKMSLKTLTPKKYFFSILLITFLQFVFMQNSIGQNNLKKNFSNHSASSRNIDTLLISGDSVLAEGCDIGKFVFRRNGTNINTDTLINFIITGSAINGVDYHGVSSQIVPNSVLFPAGLAVVELEIIAVQDWIKEKTDTITIKIPKNNLTDTIVSHMYIKNVDSLNVSIVGDTLICEGTTLSVSIEGGNGPFSYEWAPNNATTSSVKITPLQNTIYFVTVTDSCGLQTAIASLNVNVFCPIEIPNIFTPNADNFNDYFQIKHIENYPNSKLVILNRWGDKVFESLNYQNEWAGKDCSEGTYYYILNLSDGSNYKGIITLLN